MVQLELGDELEFRLRDAASISGVSVDRYVREGLLKVLPRKSASVDAETVAQRVKAAEELKTFAKDRNIQLPEGVTIRSLLEEARRF